MAVIVRYEPTGVKYFLIGTGHGAYASAVGSRLMRSEKQGAVSVVVVCDGDGKLHWVDSDDITVLSVDGRAPSDLEDPVA